MINTNSLNDSLSDCQESYTEEQQKSHKLYKNRSLRFQESMSSFLRPEKFDNSVCNPYAPFPKVRWSTSRWDNEDIDSYEALEALTGKKWKIFKVSPMYTFSYSDLHLKKYSTLIKRTLERGKCLRDSKIEVTINILDQFSATENDEPGVQIIVEKYLKNGSQVLYTGYLISWKSKSIIKNSEVKLPILLCYFKNNIVASAVHSTIKRLFDMSIEPFTISQDDFLCFSVLIIGYLEEDSSSVITFEYHSPDRPKSEVLRFTVALSKLQHLWKRVHNADTNILSAKKLLEYQLSIECHIENTYRVYLENLHFTSILVPKQVTINVNGKIKFKSSQVLNILLKYLTNKT